MKKYIYRIFWMRKLATILALGIAFSLYSNFASAQKKWSLTFRPGLNIPTKNIGNTDLKTGFGMEGTIGYRVLPYLGAYAGWSWNKFSADKSFTGNNNDFEETGYNVGLQFIHPLSKSSDIQMIIGGGGTYNHIEIENTDGDIIGDSGHGLGWQIDAGLMVPIGKHLNFIPGLRYRALSRDLKTNTNNTAIDLNYFSVGAGISFTF